MFKIKKLSAQIISLFMVFTMIFSNVTTAFASNHPNNQSTNYVICNIEETEYGTAYHVIDENDLQTRSLWDLVDVVMAGASWAKLFSEPSWGNFGWAVLDTAALLPLLPSSAYFREGGKVFLKIDEVADFAKTTDGKKAIEGAMIAHELAEVTYSASQLQKKFKHAIDFGISGNYNLTNRTLFKNALEEVVDNADEIYKSTYHGDVIVYIKDGLGVITELDGTFVSGWKLNADQLAYHRGKIQVK